MPLVATKWLLGPSRPAAVWTEHGYSFPSALEPHLAVLPAHKLLLVDPHTVLVEEAVLR
ncbi:MAG: hypothetical protein ACRDSF_08725 [Pseudonocardiaceae bacterium]